MSLKYGFALAATDSSEDFSGALNAVTGDGIARHGGRMAATVNGFTINLSSGYAFAAGRYLNSDEPYSMTIAPPPNNGDRVDALAVRVDHEARRAALDIIADVDISGIRSDLSAIRNDAQYCILLYLIRIRRGATSLTPNDITDLRIDGDLCGSVVPLSDIAGDVIRVYQFLNGGIDAEVARLIGLSNAVIAKANAAILELDNTIKQAGGGAEIGDLMTVRRPPSEPGWLLCDGGAVPAAYPVLSVMLDGTLPDISNAEDRYRTYIYGGSYSEV